MYRSDEIGHEEAELNDEIARLDDEAKALIAEIDASEQQDRERDARDNAFFRKFRVVEIVVGIALLVAAWAWQS